MRPLPPKKLTGYFGEDLIEPSSELNDFIEKAFLNEKSKLFNEDHVHLKLAQIGFLWTNVPNIKQQRQVAGTAEIPFFRGNKWQNARGKLQLLEWFGFEPDFIITLDSIYCHTASDNQFCALLEHELYHCGQAFDDFGSPKFNDEGQPIFAMRGHDVEEFVGVVKRYGIGTVMNGQQLIDAASEKPLFDNEIISNMCGSC